MKESLIRRGMRTFILVSFALILCVACAESPYDSFCGHLTGEAYSRCISEPAYRDQVLEQLLKERVATRVALLERLPASLLGQTVNEETRANASRVNSPSEIPATSFDLELNQESAPELDGAVFVVRAGAYIGLDDEGSGATVFLRSLDEPDESTWINGDRLTTAQKQFLDYVCDFNGKICVGDFYVQILPHGLLPMYQAYLVGADLDRIDSALIEKVQRESLRAYLIHLREKAENQLEK